MMLDKMAKQTSNANKDKLSTRVRERSTARGFKTKFGSVVVTGARPSASSVKANVSRSTEALARVTKKLVKPGVSIRQKKDVPQFSVVEDEPGVFIRRLNGRIERGDVVAGVFRVID